MKKYINIIVLITLSILLMNGCYTNINTQGFADDKDKVSSDKETNSSMNNNKTKTNKEIQKNELVIIVIDGLLLGAYENNNWLVADDAAKNISGEEVYNVFASHEYIGSAKGSKPELDELYEEDYLINIENINDENNYEHFIAIGCNSNVNHTKPKTTNEDLYNDIVKEVLHKENKSKSEAHVIQGISADLDNDGYEEHIISVNYYDNKDYTIGGWYKSNENYSYLILSRETKEGRQTIITKEASLVETNKDMSQIYGVDIGTEMIFESQYNVIGIIDINTDGVMEVVCSEEVQDGILYSIFEIKDGVLVEVLKEGIGN